MIVIVWVVEGTWTAVVDAAAALAPSDAEIVLLHVAGDEAAAAARGAAAGLLGRGLRGPDPGDRVAELAASATAGLMRAAAAGSAGPSRW